MAGLRFAGQEGVFSILDTTTGDQLLADMAIEKIKLVIVTTMTEKEFIGALFADYREFMKGYSLAFTMEHTDASQSADIANRIMAKMNGLSTDEFAAQFSVASPDGGKLKFTCRDLHWGDIPFDLASRTDFLTTDFDTKGAKLKIEAV